VKVWVERENKYIKCKKSEQIYCKTCVVRVGTFTDTKAVNKMQAQGSPVTDKLRSCFKTL